jgi:hypothetical protein
MQLVERSAVISPIVTGTTIILYTMAWMKKMG